MIYLAPNNTPTPETHFGLLISLNSQREIKKPQWAIDNGRFSKRGVNKAWTVEKWEKMLVKYQNQTGCVFCVVPDVPYNAAATLAMFPQYHAIVKSYGYPSAICTQDGMTPNDISWQDISAVFIGGSDKHKLGKEAVVIMMEAIQRGKWVHVGRVNSPSRIMQFWYADSVDGTTLAIEKSIKNIYRIMVAVDYCQAKKLQEKLL